MAHLFNRIKFGGYHWNLNRISSNEAKPFIGNISNGFSESLKNKELDWSYFDVTQTR